MTAGLGFFGAKRWTETVHFTEGGGRRFVVQLAALRQIRLLSEVVSLEQGGRSFACIRREDRRIEQDKPSIVKKIPAGANDLVAYPKDGVLPMRAKPEVPVFHQKAGAVLLRLYRKFFRDEVNSLKMGGVQFEAAGSPNIGSHPAGHDQR